MTTIARFFAGSLGAILCGSFILSVIRDSGDIARFAWTEGADLLGTYGGAGIIAIPFVGFLTAYLRAGRALAVTQVSLDREAPASAIFFRTSDNQTHTVSARDIASAHRVSLPDGRERLVMSLGRGLETGDRYVFEGPTEKMRSLVAPVAEHAQTEVELTRTRLWVGYCVAVLSALFGTLISSPIFAAVTERAQKLDVLTAQTADSWELALFVAFSSLSALAMSLVLAARRVRVGLEGLLVRGPLFERFVSSSRLQRPRSFAGAILVPVKKGLPVFIPSFGCDEETVNEVVAAIESLRTAAHRAPSPGIERLVGSWREAIRQPKSAGGYRDGGVPFNELAALLRSARSSPEERVGSAALMIASGDSEARDEVRRVAQLMVLDDTRARLLALTDEEEREALAEADIAEAQQPKRLTVS